MELVTLCAKVFNSRRYCRERDLTALRNAGKKRISAQLERVTGDGEEFPCEAIRLEPVQVCPAVLFFCI